MANKIIDQETYDVSRMWAEDMIATIDEIIDFDQESRVDLDDDQITEACIELQFALEKYYRACKGYDIEAHPMVEVKAFDRQPIPYTVIKEK
jgi:hypothetical protein